LAAALLGAVCVGCPVLLGVTWHRYLGTEADDAAYAIERTSDCGYILAGFSEATPEASDNARMTKLNAYGLVEWQVDFGDERDDFAVAVAQAADGGYVLAGQFGDESASDSDAFLLKTDTDGIEEWRQLYDSGGQDRAVSIETTADGGYLLGLEMDVLNTADATMIKTNAVGVELWRVSGPENAHPAKAIQTADGGCILAWWQLVPGAKAGSSSGTIGLLKTDAAGLETWRVALNDDEAIALNDMRETDDGGLILVGQIDFLGNDSQLFLWKTDAAGVSEWRTTYGDQGRNTAYAVYETSDGDFVAAGESQPSGEQTQAMLLRTDDAGIMRWLHHYGGEDRDIAYGLAPTETGGFLLAGVSESSDPETEADQSETLLTKTDCRGHSDGFEVED